VKHLYYIQGPQGLAGVYVKQSGQTSDKLYYAEVDHLGSILRLTDDANKEVFAATYDAWGNQTVTNNTFDFHRGYTGHEHLPEFGLINMNGRMYDPALGRMLSPDNYVQSPLFSQSYNRYSYCANNPLKFTDPDGMSPGDADDPLFGRTLPDLVVTAKSSQFLHKYDNWISPLEGGWPGFHFCDVYGLHGGVRLTQPFGGAIGYGSSSTDWTFIHSGVPQVVIKIVQTMQLTVKNFDISKVAIGKEISVGFDTESVIKGEANAILGNIMFLGGADAGYVYSYYGGEAGFGAVTSIGANLNTAVSYFVAYNTSIRGDHKFFEGTYTYININGGLETEGVEIGVAGNFNRSIGRDWTVWSVGFNVSLGAGISTPIIFGGLTGGQGKISFFEGESVGTEKSIFQKILSWSKLF